MKAIQLLVNSQLPPDLRDYNREFDSKSLGSLMADVARKYPEQYERISKAISDIGRKASYFQGESLTLEDNRPVIDRDKILAEMDNEIEESKRTSIDKDDFESKKVGIWHKYNDRIQTETSKGALAKKNNLAYSVMSGARGKPPQLKMMLSTPGLYTDSQDNIIPLFIRTSFAEGLRPAEYLAGTYGARKSVLCLHEDTLVRLADGSSLPIKYTKPGMFVLGADKEGNTFPARVVRVYNQGLQPVYRYIFVNGQEVVCTKNHKFLSIDKKYILTIEDIAKDKNTISATLPASVSNCYDIEVEHEDHLFVLDSGLITSNSTKRATAKGGDLAKQMVQSAANLVVSENDCGAANGIDLEVDDKSLRGRVLARDLGNVPAGTVLDKSALASIRKQGFEKLIARSPMTCQAKEGVCARCMGLNALGKFPSKGETVGITAAQSLGEPITQGALNCLAKNTLVLMHDHSEKAIQDIQPGDLVMGADTQGNIFPTEVTHVWDQGMQPVQRRYYKMGQTSSYVTLESTAAHPLLSNRKTYGINQGKNNATPEKLIAGYPHKNLAAVLPTDNISSGKDEPWAVFLGAFLGDGIRWDSTSEHTTSVKLSCADISEIEDINSILRPLNVQLVKCARSYDWRFSMLVDDVSSSRDASGRMTSGYRNPCKLKLIEYGLDNKYAHNKAIHPTIWQWSVKSVAALIAGFIATDGSVYKNKDGHIGVAFTSTSKSLLEELQRLLRFKLCVYSSRISLTGKTGTGCRKHDQWQFTVTRLDQIKRLHNFIKDYIPGCKKQKLQSYIDNSSYELRNTDYFYRAIRRNDMEEDLGMLHCYDITVAHKDSLFVLANSLIVSNTKHQGGAAGADRRYAGFAVINQFVQTPDTFPDKAILSRIDGQVNSVIEAPQGGYYVTVDNEPHYVAPGYPVTVKVGDRVEAGDTMSEGLPDPGEVVELRGLGEGRKYYADKLKQLLDDSGMEADRRNTELMSRAALDHLQITDAKEDDEYLPDDVVSYSYFSNRYTPPKDTNKYKADKAIGTYLQSPALHYTIGTRITPKIATHLKSSGFDEIFTSPESPTFKPHMVRLRAATHHGDDWLASMHTSYLKKQLSDSAIRGEDSNVEKNIHFAPRLAIGTNFGENIEQTGKF
jgi:hypothetical protein